MNEKQNILESYEEYLKQNTFLKSNSIKQYISQLKTILEKLNTQNQDISQEQLIEDLNKILIQKLKKKNTRATTTSSIKHFLDFLKKPYLKLYLKTKTQNPKKQKKYLNYTEIKQTINQIKSPTKRAILSIQLETGLRIAEIVSLQAKNISINPQTKNLIIQIKGKGDKPNELPIISPTNKKIIITLLTQTKNPENYLFLNNESINELKNNQIQTNKIIENIERQKKALYMGYYRTLKQINLTTHDIRRAFAIRIYELTKDIAIVSKMLNHKKIETTQKYIEGYLTSINKEDIIKKIV